MTVRLTILRHHHELHLVGKDALAHYSPGWDRSAEQNVSKVTTPKQGPSLMVLKWSRSRCKTKLGRLSSSRSIRIELDTIADEDHKYHLVASTDREPTSPFYVPVDIGHTALLLADIQDQIASRFSPEQLDSFTTQVLRLTNLFRAEIVKRCAQDVRRSSELYENVPLIVYHVFPAGINANGFISPYNKLSKWFKKLEAVGAFSRDDRDPNHPSYKIIKDLQPEGGRWGTKDEIIVPKLTAGCFSSSELQGYFRAREIKHVVLCGLTTAGAILRSARLRADLDFHVTVPRQAMMDDDPEVNDFLLEKVLPRLVDVVDLADVENVFEAKF
jgi:nicotinamidase-related amidase